MFLRDDSAADSDTHPTRRTGFETELEANVRKVVGINPTDKCIVPVRFFVDTKPRIVPVSAAVRTWSRERAKTSFLAVPFLPSCLLNCHMANEYF